MGELLGLLLVASFILLLWFMVWRFKAMGSIRDHYPGEHEIVDRHGPRSAINTQRYNKQSSFYYDKHDDNGL